MGDEREREYCIRRLHHHKSFSNPHVPSLFFRQPENLFLVSLAISDLLVSILVSFAMTLQIYDYRESERARENERVREQKSHDHCNG